MPIHPQRPPHWREGMFLSPQHFQAFQRWITARISKGEEYGSPGRYGFQRLRIDDEALKRDVFHVEEAEVLFLDGTLATFPSIGRVSERNFAEHFTGSTLDVYLGIPAAETNVSQVSGAADRMARYEIELSDEYDENSAHSKQALEFRRVQGRLFFGDEDRTAFETLPIAKLERKGRPILHNVHAADFVPPILACGASPLLMELLRDVADVVQRHARGASAHVPRIERMAYSDRGAEISSLIKLFALNIGLATARQLPNWKLMHPFDAYQGLLHVAGALGILEKDRVTPELPAYDHRELGPTFVALVRTIVRLANTEDTPPFDRLLFEDDKTQPPGLMYAAEILPEWIEHDVTYFIGVEMAETPENVRDRVTKSVKLAAQGELEKMRQHLTRGIDLVFLRLPPISLPNEPNLHYFRVKTEGENAEHWKKVLGERRAQLLSAITPAGAAKFHFFVEYPR